MFFSAVSRSGWLDEAGIEIASETIDATVHGPQDGSASQGTS